MGFPTAVTTWGSFIQRPFIMVAVAVTGLRGLLTYALAETRSVPWSLGYGLVAILSTATAQHLRSKADEDRKSST
jgi:hypothetical protein